MNFNKLINTTKYLIMKDKILLLFFMVILTNCSNNKIGSTNSPNIKSKLSIDKTHVEFYPLPDYAIQVFISDSLSQKQYQNLFAVYPETLDPDMRDLQEPLEGDYSLTDTSIIFRPTITFKKNQKYFALCNIKSLLIDPSEIITNKKLPGKERPDEVKFEITD